MQLCDSMDWSLWNSPGKNIGVGSHSLLQGIFPTQGSNLGLLHYRWILYLLSHGGSPGAVFQCVSCSVMSDSLRPHGIWPARLLCPWNSPGKNTGVGCHSFIQGIFPTQGSNLGLLHCRQILHHLSHKESPN